MRKLLLLLGLLPLLLNAQTNPTAFNVTANTHSIFTSWVNTSASGTAPANMAFWVAGGRQESTPPTVVGDWNCAYNLTANSRFVGRGVDGISLVNVGNSATNTCSNPSNSTVYPYAVILALNTVNRVSLQVVWTGGTVAAGVRPYFLQLQYRVGSSGSFTDISGAIYNASTAANTQIFTSSLPAACENQSLVQVRWIYGQSGSVTGTRPELRLDEISVNSSPIAPTLTATPTTIPAFNYVLGNGPSTSNTYTLSGAALTPSAGDITVTAPTDFEVSKTGVTTEFADNVTVAYTGGTLANVTIYARLKAGLAVNSPNPPYSGNIMNSGGGASNVNVVLSGTVTSVPPPVITTTGTLSTFYTVIGTPSAPQPYTVEGMNLVSDITITAPTDFEIKTSSATTYANTLMLTPSSGNVTITTIDVRLKGTTTGTFSGNISHAATNVSPDINMAVNGIVGANCGIPTNIAAVRATIPVQRLYTEGGITTITGRVTARLGTPKFYLQDATGGIAVYSTNDGGVAQANNIAVGDSIILTGQIYRALGESEIFNPTCVTKISTGIAPAPVIFNSNTPPPSVDLNTFLATNEGKLVKIISTNVLSSGTFVAANNYTTITCNSQGGTEIRVDAGATTLPGSAIPTATQDITGVVGHFISTDGGTDKLQIFPRSATDLSNSSTTCTISGGCGVTTFTDSPTQLDVFNWNIEWIGSPANGPSQSGTNDVTQIANAQSVLNGVGADVYMLQEICQYNSANPTDNTTAFGKLVQGLNTTFGVNAYSGECSAAVSTSNPDGFPQRVCIIYKNSVVTKVFSRPMFNGFTPSSYPPTGTPSQFWASGRKPFMFMAKVEINSKSDTILFVGLHAKAGSDTTSYKRRMFDIRAMYDTLQTQYPTRKTIVIGDLNDDVDKSITRDSISTYKPFLYANPNETAINGVRPNADWNPIAKTLSDSFCASTASFTDYIDHQIISNEMTGTTSSGFKYVPASVTSFRPAINNYASTTSDHYPTIARYQHFTLPITSIATGNWSSPTTWDCNCIPTATDNVVIDTPHTVTVDSASQAKSINLKGILNYLAPFVLSLGQ